MISKKISCKPENNNFRRLGNYIADASHEGEKMLMAWASGCMMDEYQDALSEIEDTQALNTRTKRTKTYHLVISFHPEDEGKLSPQIFTEIEKSFAHTLGLENHQRLCGVHKNTNNIHMHIAYNLVNPTTLTFNEPYRDFFKMDKLRRELEKRYDLKPDKGIEVTKDPSKLTEPAARIEIQTGLQSFEGYVKSHRDKVLPNLEIANSWQQIHETLATYGMRVKLKGNGLVITDQAGKVAIKASTFDRNFSKGKLEARFGPFAPAKVNMYPSSERYSPSPVQKKTSERDKLFAEYSQQIDSKRKEYKAILHEQEKDLALLSDSMVESRKKLFQSPLFRSTRAIHLEDIHKKARRGRLEIRQKYAVKKKDLRNRHPYKNWTTFLQHKALEGDETALAILRSKKEKISPEKATIREKDYELLQAARDKHAQKIQKVENSSLRSSSKRALLSIFRMQRLANENPSSPVHGFKYRIDTKGVVIFTLPSGAVIRDEGREILFSGRNDEARKIAEQYAKLKWGNSIKFNGNILTKEHHKKDIGMSR